MAARIGSPSFLALVAMCIGGASSSSQVGPFLNRKLDKPGFNISSGGLMPEVEAFLDQKFIEFWAPLLLREKVCAVSPSLIISPVDSASSSSQVGPKASGEKEHLKKVSLWPALTTELLQTALTGMQAAIPRCIRTGALV